MGDIWDEFEKEENHLINSSGTEYFALGKTKLEGINETLNVKNFVEDYDYDSLVGYILNKAGAYQKTIFLTENSSLSL